MRRIVLFVEDVGHEVFLSALVARLAREYEVEITIEPRSVRGGSGKVLTELRQYLRDLQGGYEALPDLLVVARDANCRGVAERRREIAEKVPPEFQQFIVYAIPDPHIERWLLVDSAAFKAVLGKGCAAPDQKCERGRYKRLLLAAIQDAGLTPLLGGIEHAADIVDALDLRHVADDALKSLVEDLHREFRKMMSTEC